MFGKFTQNTNDMIGRMADLGFVLFLLSYIHNYNLIQTKIFVLFSPFPIFQKHMFNPCNSWRRCHCDCMAFSLWSHGDRGVHTELALMALSRCFHCVHRVVTTRSLRVHCAFTELTLRWRRFVWHSEVIETADMVLISQALLDGTHQSLFPKQKSCIFQAGINNTLL